MDVIVYRTAAGKEPLVDWLKRLDVMNNKRIRQRLERLRSGNYGDYKALKEGIFEMRFFFGAGYRIYFAQEEDKVILLLCGGDKSNQQSDIAKAHRYLMDYKDRNL